VASFQIQGHASTYPEPLTRAKTSRKVCFRFSGEHPTKVTCCSITYDVVAVEFKHRARGIEDSSDEVEGFGEAADDSGVGEAVETNTYKEVCG